MNIVDSKIEFNTVSPGLEVGIINLKTNTNEIINNIHFKCKSIGECCSTLKIPVTEHDINRILENGYDIFQIIEDTSPIILPSKTLTGQTEKVYIMKRKPFTNECTFFENNRCKIHDYKPFACKIYPFALEVIDDDSLKIIVHTGKVCKSIKKGTFNDSIEIMNKIRDMVKMELKERNIKI